MQTRRKCYIKSEGHAVTTVVTPLKLSVNTSKGCVRRRRVVKSKPDSDLSFPKTVLPNENIFNCDQCDLSFAHRKYLLKHNQRHRNLETSAFECSFCSRRFMTKAGLYYHISIHTNEKWKSCIVSCHLCNKEFSSKGDLNVHMASHQTQRPHQCKKCDKCYKLKKHLTRHLKTHNIMLQQFPCTFCSKTFKDKSSVSGHIRVIHLREKFKCEYCEKELSGITALKYHTMVHKRKFAFKCEICGKKCRSRSNLKAHQRTHSTTTKTNPSPWTCKLCGKTYVRKHAINRHLKSCITIKTNPSPWTCKLCGKTYVRKHAINRHLKSCITIKIEHAHSDL